MKKTIKRKKLVIVLLIVLAVLVLLYAGLAVYFQKHFYFRTSINNVSVSGGSFQAAKQNIAEEMNNYELKIVERDGQETMISGQAIGIEPLFDEQIENLLEQQNGFAWPYYLVKGQKLEAGAVVGFDTTKLKEQLLASTFMDKSNWTYPKDAYISDYTAGKYEIIPQEDGTEIDFTALQAAVEQAIGNLQDTLNIEKDDCYVKPEVTEENKKLKSAWDKLNQYVGITITYDVGDKKEKLDGSLIHTWLKLGSDWKVTIDEELVLEYVKELARKYNTAYRNRTLDTSYGQTVTIQGGDYGWRVDNDGEAAMIIEDLKVGESVQRELVYAQTANSHGDHDYGNTYVEINLTAQHLFFYKDGALLVETDFVSGNLAKNHGTPVGAYGVTYKQRNATLRGQDYESDVSYWMPYCNDVGMHDASWRGSFGGSIYKRSGSHGCVNLPISAAKTIFENIEAGYPVLVYELPGTESAAGIAQDQAYEVDELIKAIGEVTLDSEGAITTARAAYDALAESAKGYVKNLTILTSSEAVLAQQKADAENQAASTQAQQEAQPVIEKIQNIGEVTANSRKKIEAARAAYDALSEMARTYVTNFSDLVNAEEAYRNLSES